MTTPLTESFRALARLHALDQERLSLEGEAAATPKSLADLAARATAAAAEAHAAEIAVEAAERVVAAADATLSELGDRVQRAEKRIVSLATSAQVEATEREIASLRAQIDSQETASLTAMEAADAARARRAATAERRDQTAAALASARAAWADRGPLVAARIEALRVAAEPVAREADPEGLRLYRTGLHHRGNAVPAGAAVLDSFECPACRKALPPKWVNETRAHAALHACDGCKRLLLWHE